MNFICHLWFSFALVSLCSFHFLPLLFTYSHSEVPSSAQLAAPVCLSPSTRQDPRDEWVARRWHTTGALCLLPNGLPSKTRRQDKTRVEREIICRSVTPPVTSGETENSRHYLVCCWHPLWCLRVCVAVWVLVSFHKPSDRRVSREGNGCRPQEWYNDSGRKMQHGICFKYFVFGYLPVLGKKGHFEGRISCVIHDRILHNRELDLFKATCCFLNNCSFNKYKGGGFSLEKKKVNILQLLPFSNPTIYINGKR